MTFRYRSSAHQQVGTEFLRDEGKRHRDMGNAEARALQRSHGEFTPVVLGAVVEAESGHDLVRPARIVESRDGIDPAAQQDDSLHRPLFFPRPSCVASTRMAMPPRGAKSPITAARRGAIAATMSSRILLVIASAKTA